jgi:hypothetical protein
MPAQPLDLLQETVDILVLQTLAWGPIHGCAVASWVVSAGSDDDQRSDFRQSSAARMETIWLRCCAFSGSHQRSLKIRAPATGTPLSPQRSSIVRISVGVAET